jgi:predicted nucleic acid-binding protein
LDDLKARKIATRLGLNITGTIDILLLAKKQGLLKDIPQLVAELKKLQFRIFEELENLLLN